MALFPISPCVIELGAITPAGPPETAPAAIFDEVIALLAITVALGGPDTSPARSLTENVVPVSVSPAPAE